MSAKNNEGNVFDLKLLKRIVLLAKPYKRYGIIAIITTISLAILMPLQPILIRLSLDKYIANGDLQGLTRMLILVDCFVSFTNAHHVCEYLFNELAWTRGYKCAASESV